MKSLVIIVKIEGLNLTEILQILLQTLTGEENPTLYCTDRQGQFLCYLTVLET